VSKNHPLRRLWQLVDLVLRSMNEMSKSRYAKTRCPPIPPEHLLRALLFQALFSICSGRQLMEQLDCNLLFCCFVGQGMGGNVGSHYVLNQRINREPLLDTGMSRHSFRRVLQQAEWQGFGGEAGFDVGA
jgi:transposase